MIKKYNLALVLALALAGCGGADVEDSSSADIGNVANGVIAGSQKDLETRAGNIVYFGYDKSDLGADATKTLKKQAAWLKLFPKTKVVIEGNCDDRGTRKYNQALGERRANAAKRYLVAQGIPAARITTVSYGKDKPAVLGTTEDAYAKNRRDVTIVAK